MSHRGWPRGVPKYKVPADLRFWQNVKFGEGMNDCWEWTGACNPVTGHAQFNLNRAKLKRWQVHYIRNSGMAKRGTRESQASLADFFEVSVEVISRVQRGLVYKHEGPARG